MDSQSPMALPTPARPAKILTAFDDLLKQPALLLERAEARDGSLVSGRLFAGALLGWALYGGVAGLFQGGPQALVAAVKAPLIVVVTMILCAPSFYVFGALAGAELSPRRFLGVMTGLSGILALLMLGLLPVAWLFTVSSRSLWFVVWLHLLIWWVALLFGLRFLMTAVGEPRARAALLLWMLLFSVVSYQVTTYVRPVLWREPGAPLVESAKLFFLEHFMEVARSEVGTGG